MLVSAVDSADVCFSLVVVGVVLVVASGEDGVVLDSLMLVVSCVEVAEVCAWVAGDSVVDTADVAEVVVGTWRDVAVVSVMAVSGAFAGLDEVSEVGVRSMETPMLAPMAMPSPAEVVVLAAKTLLPRMTVERKAIRASEAAILIDEVDERQDVADEATSKQAISEREGANTSDQKRVKWSSQ